jgi:alpha-D-xyloside xylohydrolase
MFLAAGGIVPLLRPTIDSLSPTTQPGTAAGQVDSYATSPGILWARIAPGPASSFALFDGSELGQEDQGTELLLTTKDGGEFKQGFIFEIIGFGMAPKGVKDGATAIGLQPDLASLEASAQGYAFAPERNGTLWIKVASGSHTVNVSR